MPPIPVLVVLAFVGLVLYMLVGAVVAVAAYRIYAPDGEMERLADGKEWGPFSWFVGLWPFVLGAGLVIGLGVSLYFVLLWFPIRLCKNVGLYLARSQVKEIPNAT